MGMDQRALREGDLTRRPSRSRQIRLFHVSGIEKGRSRLARARTSRPCGGVDRDGAARPRARAHHDPRPRPSLVLVGIPRPRRSGDRRPPLIWGHPERATSPNETAGHFVAAAARVHGQAPRPGFAGYALAPSAAQRLRRSVLEEKIERKEREHDDRTSSQQHRLEPRAPAARPRPFHRRLGTISALDRTHDLHARRPVSRPEGECILAHRPGRVVAAPTQDRRYPLPSLETDRPA